MTDVTDIDLDPPQEPAPKGKKSLLLGLVAALLLGGGGFYATYSGLIGGSGGKDDAQAGAGDGHGGSGHGEGSEAAAKLLGNIAFVPLDPIMVSMPPGSTSRGSPVRRTAGSGSRQGRSGRGRNAPDT